MQETLNNPLIQEIVKNYSLSCLEPNPIWLPQPSETELLRATEAIEIALGKKVARFGKKPMKRSSFLGACLDFTTDENVEHLIVGCGFKGKNTTFIEEIYREVGNTNSVALSPLMIQAIEHQVTQISKGEVLIFHNHSKWSLNVLMDNFPLASSPDRNFAMKLKFNPFQLLKTFFGNGDVKLYVGENGFVKEFVLPPFDKLLEIHRNSLKTLRKN